MPDAHRPDWDELVNEAAGARARAYAPYSNYQVGAAVLGDDGRTYAGCNVENSSYGACLCAERNAMGQAIAKGAGRVLAAVVLTGSSPPAPPCGICLQVFAELGGPGLPILLSNPEGEARSFVLSELLPQAFGALDLQRSQGAGEGDRSESSSPD